jgi:hypothetical protein
VVLPWVILYSLPREWCKVSKRQSSILCIWISLHMLQLASAGLRCSRRLKLLEFSCVIGDTLEILMSTVHFLPFSLCNLCKVTRNNVF